jgi:hypothetical protein
MMNAECGTEKPPVFNSSFIIYQVVVQFERKDIDRIDRIDRIEGLTGKKRKYWFSLAPLHPVNLGLLLFG